MWQASHLSVFMQEEKEVARSAEPYADQLDLKNIQEFAEELHSL